MYVLFRAARYIGVPPYELQKQEVKWRNYAIEYESAELYAEAEREKKALADAKRKQAAKR